MLAKPLTRDDPHARNMLQDQHLFLASESSQNFNCRHPPGQFTAFAICSFPPDKTNEVEGKESNASFCAEK